MRLATFSHHGRVRSGVVAGDQIHPLRTALVDLITDGTVHEAGALALRSTEAVPLRSVRLLPPLKPASLRDFIAFERHLEGVVLRFGHAVPPAWYEAPAFYFGNPHSMIGAFDDVEMPPGCQLLDFELEVAAVIGRPCRDVTVAQAADAIVGYTVLNDWSARDLQAREMTVQLGPAKGKDFACTLGPWLVTPDEFVPDALMTVDVNGAVIGVDRLSSMSWLFPELIAYAARGAWVMPGDVIGSGTCGSGCLAELWGRAGAEQPPPLRVGDVVTMTVEGIGTISNRVIAGAEPVDVPAAAHRSRPLDLGRSSE
jgi:2-keto-4-pentenoate hydratase/2-oxohepta-3-ene-1,7-dioic acid hydratase in catechol pathway